MGKLIIEACTIILLLLSCTNGKNMEAEKEDLTAKAMLQGIWADDDTDMPLLRIEGDTIYYSNPQNIPVAFKVIRDSIYLFGNHTAAYKIDRQTEYSFWFHSIADNIVKLHKSENVDDSLSFLNQEVEVIPNAAVVTKKDSIVIYKGRRIRGYVYINPSRMKVTRTSYTENGIGVDNSYFDNVIHICIYEGRNLLYGKDFTKKDFSDIFPAEQLKQMILEDMHFMGVNSYGYHYQATLRVPESSVYNLLDVHIGLDKNVNIRKAE